MLHRNLFCLAAGALLMPATVTAESATALYQGRTVEVSETLADPTDLWVASGELEEINGFVLKPEEACYGDVCIPVRQAEDSEIFVTRQESGWLNVSELSRQLGQAVVQDAEHSVWSFGEIPVVQRSYLESAVAPDFELSDRQGKTVRLSDFHGKKVLLMTWASW